MQVLNYLEIMITHLKEHSHPNRMNDTRFAIPPLRIYNLNGKLRLENVSQIENLRKSLAGKYKISTNMDAYVSLGVYR